MAEIDNLRRQKKTLLQKCNKMSKRFNVDICTIVRDKRKQEIYTSDGNLMWPNELKDMLEGSFPIPAVFTSASFEVEEAVGEAGREDVAGVVR